MTRYTSRADLLIAAGESIKMQEKAGLTPMQKYKNSYVPVVHNGSFFFGDELDGNEFPLAVVEGKPVFVGDELYDLRNGMRGKVQEDGSVNSGHGYCWHSSNPNMSWLPPKPKTVMVELPIDAVEMWANPKNFSILCVTDIRAACRKALEK